jgi:hypothetical protein
MVKPLSGIVGVFLAVTLSACSSDTTAESGNQPSPGLSELISPTPAETPSHTVVAEAPEGALDAIRKDLGSRGMADADIEVVEVHRTTWRDGSLGCPEPGSVYTQALVDGWRVLVKVGSSEYDYRFGSDPSSPTLCERDFSIPTPASSKDI